MKELFTLTGADRSIINSLSLLNELIELLIGPRLLMFSVSQAFGINFPTAEWQQNATKDFVFSFFILLSFFFSGNGDGT